MKAWGGCAKCPEFDSFFDSISPGEDAERPWDCTSGLEKQIQILKTQVATSFLSSEEKDSVGPLFTGWQNVGVLGESSYIFASFVYPGSRTVYLTLANV